MWEVHESATTLKLLIGTRAILILSGPISHPTGLKGSAAKVLVPDTTELIHSRDVPHTHDHIWKILRAGRLLGFFVMFLKSLPGLCTPKNQSLTLN